MDITIRRKTPGRIWLRLSGIVVLAGLFLASATYAALNVWPSIGAQVVDVARRVVGDQIVAGIENVLLQSQDKLTQLKYGIAKARPAAPWQTDPSPASGSKAASALNRPGPALGARPA